MAHWTKFQVNRVYIFLYLVVSESVVFRLYVYFGSATKSRNVVLNDL